MRKFQAIWTLGMLAFALSGAWAQDNSTPPQSTEPLAERPAGACPAEHSAGTGTGLWAGEFAASRERESAAFGIRFAVAGAACSSHELPAAGCDGEPVGGNRTRAICWVVAGPLPSPRGLGSVTLKRLWSHFDLGLDYIGGAGYYTLQGQGLKSLQQMDIDQKISWKRGQLSIRDSFSYLPEGNFGGAYGSIGSQGIASLGDTSFGLFANGSVLGTLGLDPRIVNVSIADISENLTPKSAITAAGGYAFTHFYGNDPATGS